MTLRFLFVPVVLTVYVRKALHIFQERHSNSFAIFLHHHHQIFLQIWTVIICLKISKMFSLIFYSPIENLKILYQQTRQNARHVMNRMLIKNMLFQLKDWKRKFKFNKKLPLSLLDFLWQSVKLRIRRFSASIQNELWASFFLIRSCTYLRNYI